MSEHKLRHMMPASSSALAVLLILTGCRADEPPPSAAEQALAQHPPLEIPRLADDELMGIDRALIVLNLPWSEQTVSRAPAPAAPRGTLHSLDLAGGGSFDRVSFAFGTDAPLPGYRVIWNDSANAACGDAPTTLPQEPTLLVAFEPATGREDRGRVTIAQRDRRPGLPMIQRAAEICDQGGRLTWALTAADSARFRVIELRDPPRLLVDVMHP